MIGVIDRIENERAVVLIEGDTIAQEVIDVERIPVDAQHENAVLEVEFSDSKATRITHNVEEENKRKDRISKKRRDLDSN